MILKSNRIVDGIKKIISGNKSNSNSGEYSDPRLSNINSMLDSASKKIRHDKKNAERFGKIDASLEEIKKEIAEDKKASESKTKKMLDELGKRIESAKPAIGAISKEQPKLNPLESKFLREFEDLAESSKRAIELSESLSSRIDAIEHSQRNTYSFKKEAIYAKEINGEVVKKYDLLSKEISEIKMQMLELKSDEKNSLLKKNNFDAKKTSEEAIKKYNSLSNEMSELKRQMVVFEENQINNSLKTDVSNAKKASDEAVKKYDLLCKEMYGIKQQILVFEKNLEAITRAKKDIEAKPAYLEKQRRWIESKITPQEPKNTEASDMLKRLEEMRKSLNG